MKVLKYSLPLVFLLTFLGVTTSTNAESISQDNRISSITPYGSKVIYYTKRSATLNGLTNTIIYNDGIYCGQLYLQTWSYDKDFTTGKFWYVGNYKGNVSTGACPIN